MSYRDFLTLPIIIASVFGIGFSALVVLNIAQSNRSEQDKKLLQGEITDLRYQVKQNKLASNSTPSPSPEVASPTPSPTPSSTPAPSPGAVAGTASISIGIYGVKLTAADPVLDLTFAPVSSGGMTVAGLTSQSLLARYPACKPGALGLLVRRPKAQTPKSHNQFIKEIGDDKYYYTPPTFTCANDQAGRDILAAAQAALKNSVLPTIAK